MSSSDSTPTSSIGATDSASAEAFRVKLSSLTPKARGNLGRTPLIHQLVFALDRKLTGSTVLLPPDGNAHAVYLHAGVPSKARTGDTVAPLDRVLVHMGALDEGTLSRTLKEISARKVLHGQYLIERGLIDQRTLLTALARQVLHKVTFMIGLGAETEFAFYEGTNVLDDYGGDELTPAEPLSVIMAGVRTRPRDAVVDQTLARLGELPLKLSGVADTSLFGFTADEQLVVEHLRTHPVNLSQLYAARVAQQRVAQLTVYALVITRCLDLGGSQKPPVGHDPSRPRPARPASRPGAASPRRQRPARPPASPAPPASSSHRQAEPLPRRGFATGQTADVAARARAEARRGAEARPRRSSPTGRGAEPRPPRGTVAERPAGESARRGAPSDRGLAPLPRRGTRSTGVAAPDAVRPQPTPGSSPKSSAKGGRSEVTVEEIQERLAALEEQSYFEMLGIEQDASANQVQAAYFQLAKSWHPDRLSSELEASKDDVAKIFAKLSEAHRTLSDAEKRDAYLEQLASGGTDDRQRVERCIDAAHTYQKAEVLFKKGSLEEAAKLLQQCVEADSEPPEYRTLLAWVEAQLAAAGAEDAEAPSFTPQLASLTHIVKEHPTYERAVFYRAELLRRTGQHDKALRDYRRAVELNPRNIDAKREIRLHAMRKRKGAGGQGDESGLLGRLFGRGKGS